MAIHFRWWIQTVLTVCLAVSSAAAASGEEERGRSLPELRRALASDNGNQRRKAAEALAAFGSPQAVELLLGAYRKETHDAFGVKAAVARSLGAIGLKEAVEPLSLILGDSDYWVRRMAVEGLAEIPGEAATQQLVRAADDPDARVREAAILALGGRSGGSGTLLAAAGEEDPELAAAALEGLVDSRHPEAEPRLEKALVHDSWRVRYRAASLLARRGDPRGFQALAAAVRTGEHAGAALREASRLGDEAVRLLAELYTSPGLTERNRILDTLAELECEASTEFFTGLAKDDRAGDPHRVRASMVLFDRRDQLTAEQVEAVAGLLTEENDNLVAVALQVLLERGGVRHLRWISPLAQHRNKVIRHFSLANLKRYGGPDHEETFLQALRDDNGANVRLALEALGEIGTSRSLPVVRSLVENRKLRRYALAAAEAIEERVQ